MFVTAATQSKLWGAAETTAVGEGECFLIPGLIYGFTVQGLLCQISAFIKLRMLSAGDRSELQAGRFGPRTPPAQIRAEKCGFSGKKRQKLP